MVLLLVDGWGMSPAVAGIVVTVMPITAIVVGRFRPSSLGTVQGVACGVILLAGGLTALALMPRAGWGWTIPPQILVGAGLGLTVAGLTELAVRGRADQVVHGGWTLAARHAGVVLGLLLLAPVLTSALDENRDEAIRAGAAVVLDSDIPPLDKLGVAQESSPRSIARTSRQAAGCRAGPRRQARRRCVALALSSLQDQLDRAVTSAFSGPFLLAAALTLCALLPLLFVRRRPDETLRAIPRRPRARRGSRRPVPRARRRVVRADSGRRSTRATPTSQADGVGETIERIALKAVDDVACRLGVSREDLVLALRSEDAFAAFSAKHGLDRTEAERAIHDGLLSAVDEAEQDGTLPGLIAPLVRKAAESVSPWLLLETLERLGSFLP